MNPDFAITSVIWFGQGKDPKDYPSATLDFKQGLVTIQTDQQPIIQFDIRNIQKYLTLDYKGFKIKVNGQLYWLYFLHPVDSGVALGTAGRLRLMAMARETDYGTWQALFNTYKLKSAWFFLH